MLRSGPEIGVIWPTYTITTMHACTRAFVYLLIVNVFLIAVLFYIL